MGNPPPLDRITFRVVPQAARLDELADGHIDVLPSTSTSTCSPAPRPSPEWRSAKPPNAERAN
ncbi:hypothetical protein ACFQV2_06235 [Actinokineospora soli]|uniref:LysR substrate binding domain-containing protein n=1 Tax=Actinokineospora soli TaxID=1048753 RepID=A0ABW2TJ76_9PSEU